MSTLLPGLSSSLDLHPLFVHFPIALWPAALLLWCIAWARGDDALWRAGTLVLTLAVVAAVCALGTGWLAADRLGHDSPGHALVHTHRDLMLLASGLGLASLLASLAGRWLGDRVRRVLPVMILAGACAVMVLGADRGAQLVYGFGMGVQETPPSNPGEHGRHDHGSHAH